MIRRLDSPIVAAMLVAIAYGWFIGALLVRRDGDVSLFVVAGGSGVDRTQVPPGLTVTNSGGYDGALFYRLALDPFTRDETAYGIKLDNPAYRQQRIGYPLLVWILSFGQARLVPWTMVLVNWLAVVVLGFTSAAIARQFNRHALWGLLLPAYPGLLLSISRDMCEVVAATFVVGAVWALGAKRFRFSAALFAYAVLTRETTMIAIAALGLAWLWKRRVPLIVWLTPAVTFVLWQFVVWTHWHAWGFASANPGLATPFSEWLQFLMSNAPRRDHLQRLYFYEITHWMIIVATTAIIARRSLAQPQWKFAWLGYLALSACVPHVFWLEDFSFLRVFWDLAVFSGVLILGAATWARCIAAFTTIALWQFVARHVIELG